MGHVSGCQGIVESRTLLQFVCFRMANRAFVRAILQSEDFHSLIREELGEVAVSVIIFGLV